MRKASTFKFIGMVAAALLLAGCGDNTAEVKAMAKKLKMGKPETAAFMACAKELGPKKPIFITYSTDPAVANTAERMMGVPLEVCACQSRTMAKLFKEDKLKGHEKFVTYITKQKRKPTMKLGRKDVKQGVDPEKGAMELVASLQSCGKEFAPKFAANEGSDLFQPYELPKKKVKKKKEGEGETAKTDDGHAKKPEDKKAKKS